MGIEDVAKMATSGIQDTFKGDIMKGAGEMLAAPLQLFSKGDDKKADEEQKQQVQPIIINIINEAKGKEDEEKTKGASASASAVAQ